MAAPRRVQNRNNKNTFCCINVDRTTMHSLQIQIFVQFLRFQANTRLRSAQVPFKGRD